MALLFAVALVIGIASPVSAATGTISGTTCSAANTTSSPRVCADSTVDGVSGFLYVYGNGGDSYTARSYIGYLSEYVGTGWYATGSDVSTGSGNVFYANGRRFNPLPPTPGFYIGQIKFCVYGESGCDRDGSTVLATGSYAAFTVGSAKAAIAAGVPFYYAL